jgi:uncharacterized membrane protein YhaH (DUF805 family)
MALNFDKKSQDKKYYYSDNGITLGPFELSQLLDKIDSETLVYREGIDWTTAKELDELKKFFKEKTIIKEHVSAESIINNNRSNNKLFSAPFSFKGRIRRKEYGISTIIYYVLYITITALTINLPILGITYIPLIWFILAQGTKRCHDRNNSGWYQIIPFYVFWMWFAEGDSSENQYGNNPK